jgi:membrane protease YdiL (CAAX protease family)
MSHDFTLAPDPVPPPPIPDDELAPIAPIAHTIAIVGLFILTTSLTSRRAQQADASVHHAGVGRYLVSIAFEWILLGLVMLGIYRRREFLRTAFLNRAHTWLQSLGLGAVVYCIAFVGAIAVSLVLYFTPLFKQRNEAVILALAPHTAWELLAWFGVSLSAGICEELVFRGYLQQQLTAITRRPIAAVLVTAAVFASVHLYEGLAVVCSLGALALIYGFTVRYFKGDLRAVIVAHTLQDFIVALVLLARPYLERMQPRP